MDRPFGWEYPPGVTGSEPQITGEWPEDEEVLELEEDEDFWEDVREDVSEQQTNSLRQQVMNPDDQPY